MTPVFKVVIATKETRKHERMRLERFDKRLPWGQDDCVEFTITITTIAAFPSTAPPKTNTQFSPPLRKIKL